METNLFFSPKSLLPKSVSIDHVSDNEEQHRQLMSLEKSPISVRSKLSDMLYNIYYYQIRGSKILKYSYSEFRSLCQQEQIDIINEQKNETYRGEMTSKSARRLRKKIEIWYEGIQLHNNRAREGEIVNTRKMVFLTLTLSTSQFHSDQEIKLKILKPFFRILRDSYSVRNYVWKAESQENGNIHFHCIIDRFLDKFKVQQIWNKCQNALGYIDEFEKKYHHRNPPSTQIQAVSDMCGLLQYFEKYIAKTESYRKIKGAVWKGSQSVMSLQFFEFVGDSEVEQSLIKAENEGNIRRYDDERYSIYAVQNKTVDEVIPDHVVFQHNRYNVLLDRFLFSDEIVQNFRDYCFLFNENDYDAKSVVPLICKKTHPLPVQLLLFKNEKMFNYTKFREL